MGDHPQSILVIDDEEILLQITKDILSEFGYNVVTASSGPEGIRIFVEAPDSFALVLLDYSLPDMDGLQIYRELRRIKNNVKILFSSGAGIPDSVSEGEKLPFIPKPFSVMELVERVQKMIS